MEIPAGHIRTVWGNVQAGDVVNWVGHTYQVWDIFPCERFDNSLTVWLASWPKDEKMPYMDTIDADIHVDIFMKGLEDA